MHLTRQLSIAAAAALLSVSVSASGPDRLESTSIFADGQWDDQIIHRITPLGLRSTVTATPSRGWLAVDEDLIAPDFASALTAPNRVPVMLRLQQQSTSLALAPTPGRRGLSSPGNSFQQSLLMPGLTSSLNDSNDLTISAVLASQSYGTSMLNLVEATNASVAEYSAFNQPFGQPEVSHGAGLRVGLLSRLSHQWTFDAAAQSRIDMNDFSNIRGLYGTTAELDIPSRIQAGVQFHATARSSLRFGIEQILYSEVGAFPSRALPARFTALLGDSTSPRFEWDDLTVYSLGWQWSNGHDLIFHIDYQTRTQPLPTAPVLSNALSPELADDAILAGVTKALGYNSTLRLSASYAPPEFAFGGNVLGVVSDRLDQDVEVQALVQFYF
jgi:hypothetical protein